MKRKAIVIGCGSIGALKPKGKDYPGGPYTLTHAHAIWKNPNIDLVAVFDPDKEKRTEAARKWECVGLDIDHLEMQEFDIATIAAPDMYHLYLTERILNRPNKPKFIIVEKPCTVSYLDALRLRRLCMDAGVGLIINYQRRFLNSTSIIRQCLREGHFGKVYQCRIIYERGFRRDSSHAINLCQFLFGKFIKGSIINAEKAFHDYSRDDPTYAAFLEFEACPFVFLTPHDGRAYSMFEVDILTEKARIQLLSHGTIIKITKPKRTNPFDYTPELPIHAEEKETELLHALEKLYKWVVNATPESDWVKLNSTQAIETNFIMEELFNATRY